MTRPDATDRPDWTSVSVSSGGATIAAQSTGDLADPALLLIGGGTWSRDWWLDELCLGLSAAGLRVIRYDHRDTRASTMYPPGEPGYAGLVLVSTSSNDGTDRALPPPTPEILATFQNGEPEPDWADRQAVIEWVMNSERPYAGPGKFEEAQLRALIGQIWDRTPSMASATNHFILADDSAPADLRGLRGLPTLVVHGSADPLFPLPHGEALASLLAAPLLRLEGVGHQLPPRDSWPELIERIASLAAEAQLSSP